MSKHMLPDDKAKIFLETIVGADLKVLKLEDSIAQIQATPVVIDRLKLLLGNKELLQLAITRLSSQASVSEVSAAEESAESTKFKQILSLKGSELFDSLIAQEFLAELSTSSIKLLNNNNFAATAEIEVPNRLRFNYLRSQIEILQSALSDPSLVTNVLLGQAAKISHEAENGQITSFGEQTLSIEYDVTSKKAKITFNYGLLLQKMQSEYLLGYEQPPVINEYVSGSDQTYSININYLMNYLWNAIGSEIIFKEEQPGMFRPVAYQAATIGSVEIGCEKSVAIVIAPDVSFSMATDFENFKGSIIKIISDIAAKIKKGDVIIAPFNHAVTAEYKFSLENYDEQQVTQAIERLSPIGGTAIRDAMKHNLAHLNRVSLNYDQLIFVLSTDGQDLDSSTSQSEVAQLFETSNNKLSMYTLGFGSDYSHKFFSDLSQKTGCTHIDIRQGVTQFYQQMAQYVDSFNKDKTLFTFLSTLGEFKMQAIKGEITVADSLVSAEIKVQKNDEIRTIALVNKQAQVEFEQKLAQSKQQEEASKAELQAREQSESKTNDPVAELKAEIERNKQLLNKQVAEIKQLKLDNERKSLTIQVTDATLNSDFHQRYPETESALPTSSLWSQRVSEHSQTKPAVSQPAHTEGWANMVAKAIDATKEKTSCQIM